VKPRAERLIEGLSELELDAILVSAIVNIRYLTGFTGSNALVLIGSDLQLFVTDFRYVDQAGAEVASSFERRHSPTELIEVVAEVLGDRDIRLGFEDTHVTVQQHARLREKLPGRVELVAAGAPVEELRRTKEPEEANAIRDACRLADEAAEQVLARGLAGRTEREVALAIERTMQDLGAGGPSFETIVAAGANGARPHAKPRDVKIGPGDLVVIDWGARLDGYCSDCSRTVAVGHAEGEAEAVYELVLSAQLAGLEAIGPGAGTRAVDSAAREVIRRAGHGEHFGHGLGHGVGLEVHEAPRLSQRSDDQLAAGNTVTVEPGVYLPDRFGVRIEDLVLVTDDGSEVLTSLPKELRVID
jgi:Xaa-Pro aminopeptidase